jgi:hypothetical protein
VPGLAPSLGKPAISASIIPFLKLDALTNCENLAATYRSSGAIVIDNFHRPASTIVGDIRLNFHRISTGVGDSLNFKPIHRNQTKQQNLRLGLMVSFDLVLHLMLEDSCRWRSEGMPKLESQVQPASIDS